ncbi:MAG: gamma carbonic anhydrase family protein [Clostridiales bacterium]|nr:gamma carbonic anhydrase family protein [Clostridiales bacterium]
MKKPQISETVFLAPDAVVLGDVTIEADCSIWFHSTIRGERASIRIGEGSNVQDNCVIHVDEGFGVEIGKGVTVGHGAIIHGCRIGDNSLIGMGAILLNGVSIGKNCIIGAGALVTQNSIIPDNSLVTGNPAKVKRMVTPQEVASNCKNALHYVEEGREYAASLLNNN